MRKILFSFLALIFILALAVLGWLSMIDGHYTVSRQIEINASQQRAFSVISNFNSWNQWNPWLCIDNKATYQVQGKGNKTGDLYKWQGELIGAGEIEHLSLYANKEINQIVRYTEPFKTQSSIKFSLIPDGDGVVVTWEMHGKMPFFMRFLAKQMEPNIAMDFERGLNMLKEYIETGKVTSKVVIKGVEESKGLTFVGKQETCSKKTVSLHMQQVFYEVGNWLIANSSFPEEGVSVYHEFGYESDTCSFTSGYRLLNTDKPYPFQGAIVDSIPAGKILKVTFYGSYQNLGNAWSAAYAYMEKNDLTANPSVEPYEIYLNDPSFFPDPFDWVTDVCIPIQ
jgi:effector-binding domain-containing protein